MGKIKLCWVVPDLELYNTKWSMKNLYDQFRNNNELEFSVAEYGVSYEKGLGRLLDKFLKCIYTWRTPQDFILRPLLQRNLKRKIQEVDADILFFPAVFCCIDKKLIEDRKMKICVYTDSLMSDLDKYRKYKPLKYLLAQNYRSNEKTDIHKTDILFTQNDWSKDRFTICGDLDPTIIQNVHFGVNLNLYEGEKNYLNHKMLIVLRKGNEYNKGCKLLVEAMPLIRERIPDVTLDIVGTDYGSEVEGVTCHYNKSRSVTIELFKQTSLYVMPSIREPNGVTFLEGLANKAPIVGLDRYAFPEFAGYGEWGFICKKPTPQALADVVSEAFSDTNRLREMGIKGQSFVKSNFQWEVVAGNMINIMKHSLRKCREY